MKKSVIFECYVNGMVKYLTYNELKDRWEYFYLIEGKTAEFDFSDIVKAIVKAYPEDPVIYSAHNENSFNLLCAFSGENIIVTNKDLGLSLIKQLLLPSLDKSDKKGHGCTFEGDYKDCFSTLTPGGIETFQILLNINHPFMSLLNRNRDKFKGVDKEDHEFFIDNLLGGGYSIDYLKPLKEIQRTQKLLLDFYVEKGILTKEAAERYILTAKDFCPYDMGEDFLK